ncbi:PRC-barrel domain containing protein [Caldicellulosiruptoraceae bacterium PP1]
MRFSQLQDSRPIINMQDGRIVGNFQDIDIVIDQSGFIQSIELKKRNGFKTIKESISWENIKVFGDDAVLVMIDKR